jgi:hypothetical protein
MFRCEICYMSPFLGICVYVQSRRPIDVDLREPKPVTDRTNYFRVSVDAYLFINPVYLYIY